MNILILNQFITRSITFQDEVISIVKQLTFENSMSNYVVLQSGELALENVQAALILFDKGFYHSGIILIRSQFENLVRGVWLLHAASDTWIEKFSQPLTSETEKISNTGPMLAEMLKELDAISSPPVLIVQQLKKYQQVTWKALCSYSHGGLHPLSRTVSGYPPALIYDVVRNSNAIVALTLQLFCVFTADKRNMSLVKKIHEKYFDCIPIE